MQTAKATPISSTNTAVQPGPRTFYTLAAAQTVSQIGSNMSFLGVGIYVYRQTGQATPLALLSLFLILPHFLASGIAGVLADRHDRRKLMIIGDTGAALGSLALALSVGSGSFQLWHLYAAALWQAFFSSIQRPAFEASISQLVPDAQRHRANAVTQMGRALAILLASALTGVLYGVIGVIGIFLIDLISFLVAVGTSLLVRIPAPTHVEGAVQARGSMLNEWGAGVHFLWSRSPLFIMVLLGAFFGFMISSAYALTTPYVLARTGSELTLGILTAVLSVGGIVGAIAIGAWGGFKRRINTVIFAMILTLLATILFGTRQSPVVMGGALFLAMLGVSISNTIAMTLLQAKVPGEMQGRVLAVSMQLTLALTPLGYLLIGPLADEVFRPLASSPAWTEGALGTLFGVGAAGGMGGLFTICAVLALIATLLTYALPSVRNIEATLPTYKTAADGTDSAQGLGVDAVKQT